MEFKNNIQRLRKQCGLTQNEVAEKLFISYQAVSQWENGNTKPDIELLPRIAEIFNVSIDELFGLEKRNEEISFKKYEDDTLYLIIANGNEIKNIIDIEKIKRSDSSINVNLNGQVLNVSSCVNVKCEEVHGHVSAGSSVTCDDVGGNVSAGASVTCDDVGGNVSAGASVTCDDVEGHVSAGSSVTCGDITGSVSTGGSVYCETINGDVRANGDIECEVIKGNIKK